MDPFTLITGAKQNIDAALTVAKIYKDAKGAIDEIEQGVKLLEIKSNLLDAKDNVLELRAALIERDDEIQRLKELLKQQKEVGYEEPVYWYQKENGEKEGPFCQKSYDENEKLIRLQNVGRKHEGYYQCKVCGIYYKTKEYIAWESSQPKPKPIPSRSHFDEY